MGNYSAEKWSNRKVRLLQKSACLSFCLTGCLLVSGLTVSSSSQPKAYSATDDSSLQPDSVIKAFDRTQRAREAAIAGYSATEHYTVRRNGSQEAGAELTARSTYSRDKGKDFQVLSRTGSSFLQSQVLDRVLDHERELYAPENRKKTLLTTDNYEMKLLPERETESGQDCYVVQLTPKVKSPTLLDGQAYVDPKTFTVVRLKGIASASTGIVSGRPDVERDFQLIDGVAMTSHSDLKSKSLLAGETEITIDISDYKIQH